MRHSDVVDPQGRRGWAEAHPRAVPRTRPPVTEGDAAAIEPPRLGLVDVAERTLALGMLVLAAPALAALATLVLVADSGPALYRGERLGRGKRVFWMYKVRTLRRDAAQRTADRLIQATDGLEIPGGRFLRESRLDELPQLWNVVRGDMSFIGPRPERPRVYELHCLTIPGYSKRFDVRPGLIGPSQIFTPHGTHKRIRAWLDNAWGRRRRSVGELLGLMLVTGVGVTQKIACRGLEGARGLVRRALARRYREKRRLRRVRPDGAMALLTPHSARDEAVPGRVVDINEQAVLVVARDELAPGTTVSAVLRVRLPNGAWRHAHCDADVLQRRAHEGGCAYVLAYRPLGARSHYTLHQYFLQGSLTPPGVRRRRAASARR